MAAPLVEAEDDTHALVIQQFEEFDSGTESARALWQKCRDYRDGNQWTEEERKTLTKRKQPIITDNKIQDKCDTLLGMEKQMRTDPRAYPRNPSEEDGESADAATDALRYVADKCNYKVKVRKFAADNLMVEGVCYGLVNVDKNGDEPYITMERVRQDRGYYDIRSLENDFSDKRYCGYFTWMDEDEVVEEWPDSKDILDTSADGAWTGDTYDDKPRYVLTSGKRKRVQVFTHYHLAKGKWMQSTWVRGGWLDEPKPCAYKDEYGKPSCPMEIQALYRDSEGNPYGSVPRYLDLQDEHNKRRSKMLHLLNTKRIKMRKGVVEDVNALRTEVHRPDGVIEIAGSPEDIVVEDNLNEAEGQWRLLQQTDAALSATGPNAALAGVSGELSGVAKARDQQAGQFPITPLFDALDAWEIRMYRQVWCRVRQYWKAPMWVRVTDDQDSPSWVGLNQPVTQGEQAAKALSQNPQFQALPPDQQQAQIQALAQHPDAQTHAVDPTSGKLAYRNRPAEMDMDIIIDRSPDVVTLAQEEFQTLTELAKTRPEVSFKTLLKLSNVRQSLKREVMDELDQGTNPQAVQQAMQQVQQQGQLLQQAQAQLQQQAQTLQEQEAELAVKKAQADESAAKVDTALANLEAEQAKFEAYVAQQQAKLATAGVGVQQQILGFNTQQLEAERQALQQSQDGVQQDSLSNDALLNGITQAIDGMQQQISSLSQIHAQAQATAAAPKPRQVVKLTRGPNGLTGERVDLAPDGSEVARRQVALNRDGAGYTATVQ